MVSDSLKRIPTGYRPEIDGLRAVAILFVLVFHFAPKSFPGGFVGVDVFFVVSGYLISSILFREMREGRYSVWDFYRRRVRRIFPALVVVMVATLLLGWFFLFPGEFRNLGIHLAAGSTFTANIALWKGTGYFTTGATKPLLHLWSLGIEEQFYILFPVLVWIVVRARFAMSRFLLGVQCLSFVWWLLGNRIYPDATFYLPITRLWEPLAGCILASLEADWLVRKPAVMGRIQFFSTRLLKSGVVAVGLIIILCGALFFAENSIWLLCPPAGTLMVIAAGSRASLNQWFLGNPVLTGIGRISYPLYLWHWPLLFFAKLTFPVGLPDTAAAGVLMVSGALAWLTYRFVECPIRFGSSVSTWVMRLGFAMATICLVGCVLYAGVLPSRIGLTAAGRRYGNQISSAVFDWSFPFRNNNKRSVGFFRSAVVGNGRDVSSVMFIGDSHIEYYWPRIEMLVTNRELATRPVVFVTAGGSPTLPNVNRFDPGAKCDRFFDFALQEAAKPDIGRVVFGCFWENYFLGCYPGGDAKNLYRVDDRARTPIRLGSLAAERSFADFGNVIGRLTAAKKEVFVILPGPSSEHWDPHRLRRFGGFDESKYSVSRSEFEAFFGPLKKAITEAVRANGGKTIDPLDYFETNGSFDGREGDGTFRYRDGNHMRPFYVREHATFLDDLILIRPDR